MSPIRGDDLRDLFSEPGVFQPLPPSLDIHDPMLILAAHAPREPQEWFEPEGLPPMPEWPSGIGDPYSIPYLPADKTALREKAASERAAWTRDYLKAKSIQWPWAWARAVLEARPKA